MCFWMFHIYKKKIFICSKSMCHVGFTLDSHGRSRRFCITYPGTLWPHLHSSAVPVTSTLSLLSIWVVVSVPGLFPPNKVWPVPHFPLCLSLIFLQSGFFLWKWLLLMRNPGNCQGKNYSLFQHIEMPKCFEVYYLQLFSLLKVLQGPQYQR